MKPEGSEGSWRTKLTWELPAPHMLMWLPTVAYVVKVAKRKVRWPGSHENKWNLQLTGVRSWGHIQNKTETWDKRGTQESIGVTLAVTFSIGVMEPEKATSFGIPVEHWDTNTSIKF